MSRPGNPILGVVAGQPSIGAAIGDLLVGGLLGASVEKPAKKLSARARKLAAVSGAVPRLLDRALIYKSRLYIDADGAPNAYHPDNVSGSDWLANAGHSGNWWALATDTGKASGKPVVQTSGPYAGYYVSATAWVNPNVSDNKVPQRYVDSNKIPYIGVRDVFFKSSSAAVKKGDYALVVHLPTSAWTFAVVADYKTDGLGEGSIGLCRALGIGSDPKDKVNSGVDRREVVYIVFAGSADGQFAASDPAIADGQPDTVADASVAHLRQVGERKLRAWSQKNLAFELSQCRGPAAVCSTMTANLGAAATAAILRSVAMDSPAVIASVLDSELAL